MFDIDIIVYLFLKIQCGAATSMTWKFMMDEDWMFDDHMSHPYWPNDNFPHHLVTLQVT